MKSRKELKEFNEYIKLVEAYLGVKLHFYEKILLKLLFLVDK